MSGLEERLRKAVGAHLPLDPHHLTPAFTRDAIVAAAKVLAEEFGPRPEDAAPKCGAPHPDLRDERCILPADHCDPAVGGMHTPAWGDQWWARRIPDSGDGGALLLGNWMGREEDAAPPVRDLPVRRCVAENPYTGNRCSQREGHSLVHQDANGDQWRDGDEPVRELPTEPGAVLLVTGTGNAEAERPMFLANDGWHYVDNDGDACTRPPGTVTWRAATVIPTAVLTQVRAELAAIADASRFDPLEPPENVLADLRERAAEAVNVLDGEVGK